MTLDVTNNFTAGEAIVASEMNANFTDVENYVNNNLPALGTANTFTGTNAFNAAVTTGSTVAVGGALTVGANTSGHDVTFYGASDGKFLLWDESDNMLEITGANGTNALAIHDGNLYVEDLVDINGSADIAGDLTLSGGSDGALRFTNAGENSIKIPDNQASALIIEEADNAFHYNEQWRSCYVWESC